MSFTNEQIAVRCGARADILCAMMKDRFRAMGAEGQAKLVERLTRLSKGATTDKELDLYALAELGANVVLGSLATEEAAPEE